MDSDEVGATDGAQDAGAIYACARVEGRAGKVE